MKIRIYNKTARLLTVEGLNIAPPMRNAPNHTEYDIPEAQVQRILDNEQFKSWQKLAWVSVKQEKIEGAPVESEKDLSGALDDLNIQDAVEMITACADAELLLIWHDRDKRKGVKQAIEDRVAELEKPADAREDTKG